MNRRSTFLLAVIVVLVYFSLIVFMLRPLQSGRSYYGRNLGINHLGFREIPRVSWCKDLRRRSPPSTNVVALVSYPGSGNTWLRYLLQQATGIVQLTPPLTRVRSYNSVDSTNNGVNSWFQNLDF